MTQYVVKTNKAEADEIVSGIRNHIFREARCGYKAGGEILFVVYKQNLPTSHPIDRHRYRITCVDKGDPLRPGIVAVGFGESVR